MKQFNSIWSPALNSTKNALVETFDTIFDDMFKTSFPEFHKEFGTVFKTSSGYPKVDVVSEQHCIKFIAEIAGWDKENVKVEVNENILTISGYRKKSEDKNTKEPEYLIRELKKSSFSRSFSIDPKNLKLDDIKAKFDNGILYITIPKVTSTSKENNIKSVKID